jgi:hypothetical protein
MFFTLWDAARTIIANIKTYAFVYINCYLDMLGDASSNVHMQYLREGVLMTEAEENKLNQTSFIKVK